MLSCAIHKRRQLLSGRLDFEDDGCGVVRPVRPLRMIGRGVEKCVEDFIRATLSMLTNRGKKPLAREEFPFWRERLHNAISVEDDQIANFQCDLGGCRKLARQAHAERQAVAGEDHLRLSLMVENISGAVTCPSVD